MDLIGYLEGLTRDAETFLSVCTYLLALVGATRMGWLYYMGRDRSLILDELVKWVAGILFLTSVPALYAKFKNGLG